MELEPGCEIYGEESGNKPKTDTFWTIDPIDGTVAFTRGIPTCTNMLAKIEDGQVTKSIIYSFPSDDMYTAKRGEGAYKNNNLIRVNPQPLRGSAMHIEAKLESDHEWEVFKELRNKTWEIHLMCAGLEYAYVAEGKLDARITYRPWGSLWDFAPGTLLIQEAGGKVTNIGSDSYDINNSDIIAANPILHKELTQGPNAIFQ